MRCPPKYNQKNLICFYIFLLYRMATHAIDVKEILVDIAQVADKLLSKSDVSLEDVETCVRDVMLKSAQKLVEVCISASASQQSEAPIECPQCQQTCRPIQEARCEYHDALWQDPCASLGVSL